MIYFLSFVLLVAVIGIVTHKLNMKAPCDHNWEEQDAVVKCTKCNKCIPKHYGSYSEAA